MSAPERGVQGVLLGGALVVGGLVVVVAAVNGQLASFLAGFAGAATGTPK